MKTVDKVFPSTAESSLVVNKQLDSLSDLFYDIKKLSYLIPLNDTSEAAGAFTTSLFSFYI